MSNAKDMLTQTAEVKLFTKTGLTKGYYRVRMKNSKKYTIFATLEYFLTLLLFSLSNSPSNIVRVLETNFKNNKDILHYYNNILICLTSFDDLH